MKKSILCFLCIASLAAAGCGKEDITITAKDANADIPQLIVFEDGKLQSSLVQEFNQDYYDLDELKEYLNTQLESYNTNNSTSVSLNSVEKVNDNVVAVFDYNNVGEYVNCDCVDSINAKLLSDSEALSDDDVPSELTKYGKSKTKSKEDAISSKYKTLVLSAKDGETVSEDTKYEVTVDGDIKFVSNVDKVDDNTVEVSNLTEKAVIVFKP